MRRLAPLLLACCLALAPACGGSGDRSAATASIDVFGPYLGREADAFAASMRPFEERTGIRVDYTGSGDFVDDLRGRVENGIDQPDIAIVPQPGVIAQMIDDGDLVPLGEAARRSVAGNYDAADLSIATQGRDYVVPYRASIKSMVWYRPDVLAEHGWSVPGTLDELSDLVDAIDATPDLAPWCFSISAGAATGWPATDWVEDLVLRRAGPGVYDRWVAGEVGFDDPRVRAAFEEFHDLVLRPGLTAGGTRAMLEVPTTETNGPLIDDPPGCVLYKQASFASGWFPDDVTLGPDGDVDVFVLPGVERTVPAPLVVAGDGAVQFTDDPDVDRLMAYLGSPEGAAEWASRGGFVSARTTVDVGAYYDGVDQRFADLLLEDRVRRFDASDQMDPAVGSDLLWDQITAWVAGAESLDDLAAAVDAARRGAR